MVRNEADLVRQGEVVSTVAPSNGHGGKQALERAEAILELEKQGKRPCCRRLAHQSWCVKEDGHEGDLDPFAAFCSGADAAYGPLEERPRIWRTSKGQINGR